MKYFVSAIMFGFSIALIMQWQARVERTKARLNFVESNSKQIISTYDNWYLQKLGTPTTAPSTKQLYNKLSFWNLKSIDGIECLSLPEIGRATRLELARWLQLAPGSNSKVSKLKLVHLPEFQCIEIELIATGPSAGIFPFCFHLLEMEPGCGYLTDPSEILLSQDGENVALQLSMRVFGLESLRSSS